MNAIPLRHLIFLLSLVSFPLQAIEFIVPAEIEPQLGIVAERVGGGGAEVHFDITPDPVNRAAGKPIFSTPPLRLTAVVRTWPSHARQPVSLWVDSSQPLRSGEQSLPLSEFGWRSSNEEIPSLQLNGGAMQPVLDITQTGRFSSVLQFYYLNREMAVPAGNYAGRLTYTLAAP